jgi:hypothetical protein
VSECVLTASHAIAVTIGNVSMLDAADIESAGGARLCAGPQGHGPQVLPIVEEYCPRSESAYS